MKYRIMAAYKDVNGNTHYYVQSSRLGLLWHTHEYGGSTDIEVCKAYIRHEKEMAAFNKTVVYEE